MLHFLNDVPVVRRGCSAYAWYEDKAYIHVLQKEKPLVSAVLVLTWSTVPQGNQFA